MDNGSKELFAKKRDVQLGKGREAVLQYIYEVHDVKHPAIIAIALGGSVSTAIAPSREVLEPEKVVSEGVRVIGPLEKCSRFPQKPLAERCHNAAARLKGVPLGGVNVQYHTLIEEEEGAIPVRTCGIRRNTEDRTVKRMPVFQPVRKASADRRIAEYV